MKSVNLSVLICIGFFLLTGCSKSGSIKDENKYFAIEEEEIQTVEVKKYKALVVPFEYLSGKTKYKSPELVKTMLFNSLYSFLSIVPSLDVPDRADLQKISALRPSEIADAYNADFVVYGDYRLDGSVSSPEAGVRLAVWSRITKSIISNEFKIPTDIEIFDSIDNLSSFIIKAILKEDKKIAFLNFGNFKIAPEEYDLYINNRLVARPSNSLFSLDTKILSDTEYKIRLHRMSDDVNVINTAVVLKAGESTNISFKTNSMLITGFENETSQKVSIFTYDGARDSVVTYSITSSDYKEGSHSLMINIGVILSGSAGIKPTPKQSSWQGFSALRMWVAGNLKNKNFVFYVIDAGGEVFFYRIEGEWDGWKLITIPFEKMRRTRFSSPYGAVYNRIMDFPIREIKLCSVSGEEGGRLGSYRLFFDQIEVYR